jgi:phospholipid/cholesterol/gamma-HCH transport system substrate-binding protein
MMRRWAAVAGSALCGLGIAGCQFNLQGLPSPGGGPPGDSYRLTAIFGDVLNLPQRAQVKLDGVVVGQVTAITLRDDRARVDMAVARSIQLPRGTTAQVRFTTPLGEDYISLNRPTTPASGEQLTDGTTIPETQTSSAPTIEDTFALLSAVLNGGGLDQLRTIIVEVNKALGGHETQARDLLAQLNTLVSALNARTDDIDRGLTALASLSSELNGQNDVIATGLERIAPALQVLASEAGDFTTLLKRLGQLGTIGTEVITQSRAALVADLQELGPVVDTLVGIGGALGTTLDELHTLEVVAPTAVPGDYLNLVVNATVQLGNATVTPGAAGPAGAPAPPPPLAAAPDTTSDAARMLLGGGVR